MAKKAKHSKKSGAKKSGSKKSGSKKSGAKKSNAKKSAPAAEPVGAAQPAPPPAVKPDQVEVLKLALRDTEAKLVAAEHRLSQVQQQLDDERRALAAAAEEAAADAVIDVAVAETVAEAVADAELAAAGEDPAVLAEVVAEALDEAVADAGPNSGAAGLTPPLPHRPAADAPSEEWTLIRLREEARRRGLSGVSNLPKGRLVERLTRG